MDIDNTYSIEEDELLLVEPERSDMVQDEDDGFVLDFEKVAVTLALFVVTFVVLAPRGSLRHAWRKWCERRRRKRQTRAVPKEQVQVVPGHSPKSTADDVSRLVLETDDPTPSSLATSLSFPNTASLCTGMVLPPLPRVEELSDEARFAQLWPRIKTSKYRRLVLPPECKLVDKPKHVKKKKEKEQQDQSAAETTEDNPARRLVIYLQNFLHLLRSIYSYDYDGAARTVVSWLTMLIRYRQYKPVEEEEDDDEDDDVSVSNNNHNSSGITPRISNPKAFNSPTQPPRRLVRSKSSPLHHMFHEEEKKEATDQFQESPLHRRSSSLGSEYEVPLSDYGESDVGEAYSPAPPMPALHKQKKDTFENFLPSLTERSLSSPTRLSTPSLSPRRPLRSTDDTFDTNNFTTPSKIPAHLEPNSVDDLSFFDAAYSKDSLKKMNREVGLPDKNGYILGDEFVDSRHTPLLVFVNSRSGPQQGHVLITQLRRLLNPIQVWDLDDGGPETILESFSRMTKFRILVCGGDGTVSWIISAVEKMALKRWPPMAILPLGTGNDLARIHGWGGGYNNESLLMILEQISNSYISLLDRWEMSVINHKKNKVKAVKSFTNYLGVGVDAQAALQVHMLRQNKPQLFFSRAVNKAWYAVFGAEDAIKASCAHLPQEITLIADGVEVPLPPDSQGIILLNIDSYSGGVPLWSHGVKGFGGHYNVNYSANSEREAPRRSHSLGSLQAMGRERSNTFERVDSMDDFIGQMSEEDTYSRVTGCDMPSSCQDGMLDIVSIRGAFHLGQIRVGLSNAERLCQCREVKITIKKKVAVHIDGEPWRQNSSTLHIKRKEDPAIMLHRSPLESGGVETEMAKLLDWAEERGHINRRVHYTLMKEFSRRIENKARQRRFKSQENVMLSLKRAIVNNASAPSFQTGAPYPLYSNPMSF